MQRFTKLILASFFTLIACGDHDSFLAFGEDESEDAVVDEQDTTTDLADRPRADPDEPADQTAASCPAGTTPVVKNDNPNVVFGSQGDCVVSLGGNDIIINKPTAVLAGDGNDIANISQASLVAMGDGNDTCNLSSAPAGWEVYLQDGDDTCNSVSGGVDGILDAGAGDDVLNNVTGDGVQVFLRAGDDTANVNGDNCRVEGGQGREILNVNGDGCVVVPGPGKDTVNVSGDDIVVQIFDVCELEAGETLNAAGQNTTLVTPVDLATVQGMGVLVSGFENVIVQPTPCLSECAGGGTMEDCYRNCECDEMGQNCCSGVGICGADLFCECPPGFGGQTCGVAAEEACSSSEVSCLVPGEPGCFSDPFASFTTADCYVREFDFEVLDTEGICRPEDPTANCVCKARVAYPSHSPGSPVIKGQGTDSFELVAILHGAGIHYEHYDDLLKRLALNDFVAVSISVNEEFAGEFADTAANIIRRGNVLLACLKGLYDETERGVQGAETNGGQWTPLEELSLSTNNVGFVGHSRGGGSVAVASSAIAGDPGHFLNGKIRAIAQLAPSMLSFIPMETQYSYEQTQSLLVIQGSHDVDVPGDGIVYYDMAGGKRTGTHPDQRGELESYVGSATEKEITKSFIWIQGGNHLNLAPNHTNVPKQARGELSAVAHSRTVISYVNAMMKWQLSRQPFYKGFLTGERVSPAADVVVASENGLIVPQFSQGTRAVGDAGTGQSSTVDSGERLVLHSFDSGNLSPSELGADVGFLPTGFFSHRVDQARFLNHERLDEQDSCEGPMPPNELCPDTASGPPDPDCRYYSNHRSRALRLSWGATTGFGDLVFEIPEGTDLSRFNFLTFRVAQTYMACGFAGNLMEENDAGSNFDIAGVVGLDERCASPPCAGASWILNPDIWAPKRSEGAVSASVLNGVPYADTFFVDLADEPGGAIALGENSLTVFRTMRIPLIQFATPLSGSGEGSSDGVDLAALEHILVGVDTVNGGEVLLDSFALEFANDDINGCGDYRINGAIEQCDTCDKSRFPEAQCQQGDVKLLPAATCENHGFSGGQLGCDAFTCSYDFSDCEL